VRDVRHARLVAPTALAALLTVLAVGWWTQGEPASSHSTAGAQGTGGTDLVAGPPKLAALAPHQGLTTEDVWQHLSDPANSNLPPEVFAATTRVAAEVVRADATGEGRDRWPGYWADADGTRASVCCSRVEIHAAGADADEADPDLVQALVIWSGWDSDDQVIAEATAVVALVRQGGTWVPVRAPQELACCGTSAPRPA
jgi:hypothetical protein